MYYSVENCFHWMGFHIVNNLLEKGYYVDGKDDINTEKKEHLSMFVGRNDAFHHVLSTDRGAGYDAIIKVRDQELILEGNTRSVMHLPIIFGEWMPMNQEGMYIQDDFIRFDSPEFLSEGIYVESLTDGLIQWSQATYLKPFLQIRSAYDLTGEREKREQSVYMRNNTFVENKLEIVKRHYDKYKKFY